MGGAGYTIVCGDAKACLASLPDRSAQAVVCSPPYFHLRSYLDADHPNKHLELGQERTPAEFVANLVAVFDAAKRVLRDDGTLWVVIADSWANDEKWGGSTGGKHVAALHGQTHIGRDKHRTGLPPKSLTLVPQRFAIAMQDAGWVVRQDLIWLKPSAMPSSATDRCTPAHEYVWLFAKKPRYYFDQTAIRESSVKGADGSTFTEGKTGINGQGRASLLPGQEAETRVPRSVWRISSEPFGGEHYAAYPTRLAERAILASTSAHGACTRCSAPWVRVVDKEAPLDPERPQARRALALAHERGLTPEHIEAIRAVGITDVGKAALMQTGTGKNVAHLRVLAGEAKQALGGYYREFLTASRHTKGWVPSCRCNTDEVVPCLVVDPFLGSGSTTIAALRNGRRFWGCDLAEDYVDMARSRIEASLHAGNVLAGPKVRACEGQQPLFPDLATSPARPVRKQDALGRTYEGFNARWAAGQKEGTP